MLGIYFKQNLIALSCLNFLEVWTLCVLFNSAKLEVLIACKWWALSVSLVCYRTIALLDWVRVHYGISYSLLIHANVFLYKFFNITFDVTKLSFHRAKEWSALLIAFSQRHWLFKINIACTSVWIPPVYFVRGKQSFYGLITSLVLVRRKRDGKNRFLLTILRLFHFWFNDNF